MPLCLASFRINNKIINFLEVNWGLQSNEDGIVFIMQLNLYHREKPREFINLVFSNVSVDLFMIKRLSA